MIRPARPAIAPLRRRLARAALAWEQLWPAAAVPLGIAGLFLALALTDWLPDLPGWIHGLVLAGFVAGFGAAIVQAVRQVVWPTPVAARRRLEVASGLSHRPLEAIEDTLSGGDATARALWAAHQARMRAAAGRLRVGLPAASLVVRDPYGLRAALALVLGVLLIGAGWDSPDRLLRAVEPEMRAAPAVPVALDLWLTPPSFTGLPPVLATALPAGQAIQVPAGSTLLGEVSGVSRAPTLKLGDRQVPFTALDGGTYRVEIPVAGGDHIAVTDGWRQLGSWKLVVSPILPPTIALKNPPGATDKGVLKLEYTAKDEFGVAKATATIRLVGRPDAPPIEVPLTLPPRRREAGGTTYQDLTAHPWAGLPVQLQLTATGVSGQTGQSAVVSFTLPERRFTHPVAKAMVEQRRILTRSPEKRADVATALGRIAWVPKLYNDDTVVHLALVTARARLRDAEGPGAIGSVQGLLWDTALRLEDGDVGERERELRDAEQAVRDALQRDATDPEMQRLIDKMQDALDRYLDSLAQQATRDPSKQARRDPNSRMVSRQDLQKLLDRARDLARRGQRDQAQALLDQLQQMLENMQVARDDGSEDGQDGDNSELGQDMQQLQGLAQRQRGLMDRTFRQNQRRQAQHGQKGQPGQQQGQPGDQADQGDAEDQAMAGDQEALRRDLDELMRRLGDQMGEVPGGLGRADRSMRGAAKSLGQGDDGQALSDQNDALQQLREAGRNLADRMQQQAGQGNGRGQRGDARQRADSGRQQQGRDPLGRPLPGSTGSDTSDVTIPDHGPDDKAREIYNELQKRAEDPGRPRIEKDYLDRLLQRFTP